MIPGQLIAPGSTLPSSVHGLTPVTVHMSTTTGNPPCRGNFSPCEQNAKVAPGQE